MRIDMLANEFHEQAEELVKLSRETGEEDVASFHYSFAQAVGEVADYLATKFAGSAELDDYLSLLLLRCEDAGKGYGKGLGMGDMLESAYWQGRCAGYAQCRLQLIEEKLEDG